MVERSSYASQVRTAWLACLLLVACKFDPPPRLDSDASPVDAAGEPPSIEVSDLALTIVENGLDTVSVSLSHRPATDVVIEVVAQDPLLATTAPTSLTFTPDDYDVPQGLDITGVPDDNSIDDSTTISLTASNAMAAEVTVTVSEASPPTVPVPRTPINDTYQGSVSLTGSLRPTMAWSPSTASGGGTVTYELDLSTDRSFLSMVTSIATTTTSHRPDADLAVPMTAPVGARYYWRVRACVEDVCSARSPTWWVNVGRSDQDFNGDGFADVVVGAESAAALAGRACVYFGQSGGTFEPTPDGTLVGAAGAHHGLSVASAGDVNGDGFADVLVGGYGVGRAYIYFGGAGSSFEPTADATLTGVVSDVFGYAVASAGDVNADGFADVVVGAFTSESTSAGRAFLFYGGSGAFDEVADGMLTGAAVTSNAYALAVASAGDVNNDGFADVIIGARGNGGADTGRAFVYFGRAGATFEPTADGTLVGQAAGDEFGTSVAGAGDVNGDGFSDVLVGAHKYDSGAGAQTGRAYVYLGGAAATFDATDDGSLTGQAAEDYFGNAVASAGDINRDGFADVVVGAWLNNNGGSDSGSAYVFFGGPGGSLNTTADVTLLGAAAGDDFGYSVTSPGDVNGDGYGDLVVGSVASDAPAIDSGAAFVFLGAAVIDTSADGTLRGLATGDFFGVSVAAADEPDACVPRIARHGGA